MSPDAKALLRPIKRPIFLRPSPNLGFVVGIALGLVALALVKIWHHFLP